MLDLATLGFLGSFLVLLMVSLLLLCSALLMAENSRMFRITFSKVDMRTINDHLIMMITRQTQGMSWTKRQRNLGISSSKIIIMQMTTMIWITI